MTHFTKTDLASRGWSPKLIAGLLGPADMTKRNPRFRNAAPIQMWDRARVIAAEALPEFKAHLTRRSQRSEIAGRAVETKRAKLLADIEAWPIAVERWSLPRVMSASLEAWRERNGWAEGVESERPRWAVNFIRHNLTRYDSKLDELAGRVGRTEGATLIKRRVLKEIEATYPELAQECQRQRQATAGMI